MWTSPPPPLAQANQTWVCHGTSPSAVLSAFAGQAGLPVVQSRLMGMAALHFVTLD